MEQQITIPESFQSKFHKILDYEHWRKSVGCALSQFTTIRLLEMPFAEELARQAQLAGYCARAYQTVNPADQNGFVTFVDIVKSQGSSLQVHVLVTRAALKSPRSTNMSKRESLIHFNPRAKFTPTIAITINPHTPEHRALVEAGSTQRRVIWFQTWKNVINWCSSQMEILGTNKRFRIDLPSWNKPSSLGEDWWASGLLSACQSFLDSGDFTLKALVLPSIIKEAPIGLFANTRTIKPTWCLTNDIITLCESSDVERWTQYVQPAKNEEIFNKASALCHILPRLEFFTPADGDMDPMIPTVMRSLSKLACCESPFHGNSNKRMPTVLLVEVKIGGIKSYKCNWCYCCCQAEKHNMLESGANSNWYLSGASKTPIWEIFGNTLPKTLTVQCGSIFRLSRILARFVRRHSGILCRSAEDCHNEREFSQNYFVALFVARVILHECQKFATLNYLDGIITCGICSRMKPLVIDHEHFTEAPRIQNLRDFLCCSCNRHVMSVVDRLGLDKSYTTKAGLLHASASAAAHNLRQYIEVERRDERLIGMQDHFDLCAAEMFGWDTNTLIGVPKHVRLTSNLQSMIRNITPEMHKLLIRRFRQTYQVELELVEGDSPQCFLTGRNTEFTSQGLRKRLCIDHCHKTLLLRGFILGWINRSLEFVEFQPQALNLIWKKGETSGKLGNAIIVFLRDNPFVLSYANAEAHKIGAREWKAEDLNVPDIRHQEYPLESELLQFDGNRFSRLLARNSRFNKDIHRDMVQLKRRYSSEDSQEDEGFLNQETFT